MSIIEGNNTGSGVSAPFPVDKIIIDTFTIGNGRASFMRPKTITFTAQGLKPNTQYYAFFNDVYVGQYCSAKLVSAPVWEDGVIKEEDRPLVTNALGMIVGNFYLPATTFVTGSHVFKLVDNTFPFPITGDDLRPDPIYGSAEARYESNSILKLQQTQQTGRVDAPFSVIRTPVVPGLVSPVAGSIYETYYFEYVVTTTEQHRFTITTNSGTPPTNPIEAGGVAQADPATVTYISTNTIADNVYEHYYSYSKTNISPRFRQEETVRKIFEEDGDPDVAATKAQLTSLDNFAPTGLDPNATIEIVTQWTAVTDRWGDTLQVPEDNTDKLLSRTDPIAQSFTVSAGDYPAGMFATSIGVYFKTVDQSTPVILEIRDMSNGLPGPNVLPGSTSVVPGYAAVGSADATIATIFRFGQPIYLIAGRTYCFVLRSSSSGYNVWCSRVGELDVTLESVIDSQPFEGVLFKSENSTTWVPEGFEDIKFDLYKANFTETSGDLYFEPRKDDVTNTYRSLGHTLPLSFITTEKDNAIVTVKIPMHGLTEGGPGDDKDKIFIKNVVAPRVYNGYNGYNAEDLNGEHEITTVVDENLVTITLTKNATKTGPLYVAGGARLFDTTPRIMAAAPTFNDAPLFISENGGASTVTSIRADFAQPPISENPSANTFTVFANIIVDELMLDYIRADIDHTGIDETVYIANADYAGIDTIILSNNDDFDITAASHLVASPLNEIQHAGDLGNNTSFEAKLTLSSGHKDVSPVLDINAFSLVTRTYVIDNQEGGEDLNYITDLAAQSGDLVQDPALNSEILSGGGEAAAKWKSKITIFDDFFSSMDIFITSNKTENALYDLYVRSSSDIESHRDLNWTYVGTSTISVQGPKEMVEHHFIYNSYDDNGDIQPFTTFDMKIVMRSTNSCDVPKIFSARAIANYYEINTEEEV